MVSRLRSSGTAPPLSVVMPVYNVAPYLAPALDSLLAQTFTDFQVVMVDDGSTDGSAAIAADYARRHARWSVVTTANAGPGPARNRGVREATGAFIAFMDADDLLPPYAYELMMTTLQESGSDFVVGSLEQLVEGRRVEPLWLRRAHQKRRLGTTVEELPQIIHNVFVWDKIFRRSFYDRIGLTFPSLRYEDQVAMTEAYLRADAFDVVRRSVYVWRVRDDRSSITQRRHELGDLDDRMVTKKLTTDLVRRFGSAKLVDYWARHGLVGDLSVYFREIPTADEDYWQRLVTGLRDLFTGLPPIERSALRVGMRLVGWLVVSDRRSDAEVVLRWLAEHPGPLSLRVEGDHVKAALPLCDDPAAGIPASLCWLGDHELEHDARLLTVAWDGDVLVVRGWGIIRGAPTTGTKTAIAVTVSAAASDGAEPNLDAEVEQYSAPEATTWVNRADQCYDASGFTARVDLHAARRLTADAARPPGRRRDQPGGGREVLVVDVAVQVDGIRRVGRFRSRAPSVDLEHASGPERAARVWFEPERGLLIEPRP